MLLASALETAEPGQVIALVVLADGADVMLFRTTDAVASYRAARPVAAQVEAGAPVPYGKFLSWRGMVTVRAAAPARADTGVVVGRGAQRGVEVRLRRLA